MRRLLLLLPALFWIGQLSAQISQENAVDSLSGISIADTLGEPSFNTASAWLYLDRANQDEELWRSGSDSIREALQRLLDHSQQPLDSVLHFLRSNDFSRVAVHSGDPVMTEEVEVSWINDSTFVIDPHGWNSSLYLKEEQQLVYPVDFSTLTVSDSLLDESGMLDTTLFIADTILVTVIDTTALSALQINMYNYLEGEITPPLADTSTGRSALLSADSSRISFYAPGSTWMADEDSPFYMLNSQNHLDSFQMAINTLLDFASERDSTLLLINDMYGHKTPFWLSTGSDDASRFWVKNYNNDSITLWVGNPGADEISLVLEDDVNFSRLVREEVHHLPTFIEPPRRTLNEMIMLKPEPVYWDYEMSNLLSITQTYLPNWSSGGESSFSTIMDITGKATYNNKEAKTQWVNVGRLKFGTIFTSDDGFKKNSDMLEIDSKYNRNAWGKIGMSSTFYFKSQVAKGYADTVVVSKFLNPGTMTIGVGAEYKPMDKTTINIAPLSYKSTFVMDTAHIDQTQYGIDENKWSKREMGLQVVIDNEIKPFKDFTMKNKLRLFSNYLYKPQNVDVDWEIIMEQKINWFFTIRLNLHMIYDDDVLFTVYDDNGNAITLPDGSTKEVAKLQFKEFVGITLSFKL